MCNILWVVKIKKLGVSCVIILNFLFRIVDIIDNVRYKLESLSVY